MHDKADIRHVDSQPLADFDEYTAYTTHGMEVYRFLHRHTADPELSRSLTVQVFLRVFAAGATETTHSVRHRLFVAAEAELRRVGCLGDTNSGHSAATGGDGAKAAWLIEEALCRIAEPERIVLTEICIRNRALGEVAGESGITVGELHGRISDGLHAARRQLDLLHIGLP